MNSEHDNIARQIEPLPVEFAYTLRGLDDRLSRMAESSAVPQGLAQRTFDASAAMLPRPETQRPGLRLAGTLSWHGVGNGLGLGGGSMVGRVAMAASVALAFGVAVWFLRPPANTRQAQALTAELSPEVVFASALGDADFPFEDDLNSFLQASTLNSPDPITAELALLVRELEM